MEPLIAEDPAQAARDAADAMTASVAARVQEIMASARHTADAIQREAEQEAARRSAQSRLAAEEYAARVRREAEARATEYLERSRDRVDAFAQSRVERLLWITDDLLRRAEEIRMRLDETGTVRRQIGQLVEALGAAAEATAREAARWELALPSLEDDPPPPQRTSNDHVS